MKKRGILILCMLLCLILMAQAVTANEIDTNDTNQDFIQTADVKDSNHTLSSTQDNNVLNTTGKSFTELNTLLSGSGNTFDLRDNYVYSDGDTAFKDGITISKDITVNGNGFTIDGNSQARIFNILSGCSVTLNGITFINGHASDGGAIYSDGFLSMNNCKFTNNTATNDGGAVYFEATPSSLSYLEFTSNTADHDGGAMFYHEEIEGSHEDGLRHSTFTNNTAGNQGGALHIDGHDGKIYDCIFTGNNATVDGGAIMINGINWGFYDSTFTSNIAVTRRGGAIYLEDGNGTDIERCTFKHNLAGTNGGAIDWHEGAHNGKLINSTFEYNTAEANAGAVYWRGHDGYIIGSNFTHNTALGSHNGTYGNVGDGGAILWAGINGEVTNCRFIDNIALMNSSYLRSGRGGAVFLQECDHGNDNTTFIDCYFQNNTAGTNGGAVDWHEGATNGNIIHCDFINNTANATAGAVFWNGHAGKISNSTFTGNKAKGITHDVLNNSGNGGAISWAGSHGYVYNCTFSGGAAYLQNNIYEDCANTTFDTCIFTNNRAGTNGGAIDWHEGAHDGLITNSVFENNTAHANGGAVYWRGHHGDVVNSNFTHNIALGLHGGTYGNVGDGGAIIWAGINGTVVNCRFIANEARNNSEYNESGRGGAIYLLSCSHGNNDTSFTDCYFKDNLAGTNGGALDWHEGAHNGVVDSCTFINNTAKRSGGAIFWNGHNGTVKYSKFYNNRALGIVAANSVHFELTTGGDGGAIMWSGSLGEVYFSNFVNNTAARRGGAVFLQGSGSEKCVNSSFAHSYFANNLAGTNGGAIDWNDEAINGIVDNSIFINNTAKRSGGAIFWRGLNGTVTNSKFTNNRATGEYLQYNITITYDDIVIVNNNTLPSDAVQGKLYILNYTLENNMLQFKSYILDENNQPRMLDQIVVRADDCISPKDWGTDEFFGGDGGTILWSGDIGLVYNCTFVDSNSFRY